MTESSGFVTKLYNDEEYRKLFCDNPKDALARYGLDVEALVVPERIDEEKLMKRLNALFEGDEVFEPARNIDTHLSAEELWERFGAFGWAEEFRPDNKESVVLNTTAAVVIYGTSVAVSTSVIYGTTAVVSSAGEALEFERSQVFSVDHVKALRELQEVPLEDIRFNLHTKDGTVVNSLPSDLVLAFLERAKRKQ